MIDVRIAPALAAKDTALVHELAGLVNRVYAAAEGRTLGGSCGPHDARRDGRPDRRRADCGRPGGKQIVGAVRIQRLNTGEGELEMLVADQLTTALESAASSSGSPSAVLRGLGPGRPETWA